ncbi:MAG TPA: 2-phosphosulfolactate phosphatase [Gemmatimonadales bacterium]|jgi:2-phosphosulfolactate phosphatase
MKLSVYFTPHGVAPADFQGRPVLVLDILRATTTIVAALANGARAVVPAATSEDAIRIAQNLDKHSVLLAGEKRAERIPGFALGNSPLEMTAAVVASKTVVMATTNGTPALTAAAAGAPVVVGAATNFSAAAERVSEAFRAHEALAILCAGRERLFSLEDAYAAGRFAHAVMAGKRRSVELNDAALAALDIVRHYGTNWRTVINASAAAHDLKRLGFHDDIAAASEADTYDIVPVYADSHVTIARG